MIKRKWLVLPFLGLAAVCGVFAIAYGVDWLVGASAPSVGDAGLTEGPNYRSAGSTPVPATATTAPAPTSDLPPTPTATPKEAIGEIRPLRYPPQKDGWFTYYRSPPTSDWVVKYQDAVYRAWSGGSAYEGFGGCRQAVKRANQWLAKAPVERQEEAAIAMVDELIGLQCIYHEDKQDILRRVFEEEG